MANYPFPVTVKLDRARTARAFDPEESLWIPELSRIADLLKDQLRALGQMRSETHPVDLPLLAIAIFGTYGSGKTSLLMTLRKQVNQSMDQRASSPSPVRKELSRTFAGLRHRVYSLPVIKPNLTSDHDNFLYAFLATALAEIDRCEEPRFDDRHDPDRRTSVLSPVHQAFHEVSEYLQVIDDSGEGTEHDPLGVSLERLARHSSDIHLRDKLGLLIERLASYFTDDQRRSLLLLPIDDSDLAARTLINVLNTYRRYLEHPRLVPVFTFTGRMAEDLMTGHYADELRLHDDKGLHGQKSVEPGYSFQEQVALQYLAKLFPVRNRIRLGPSPARVQAAKFERPGRHGEAPGESRVLDLLEAASVLLFGHAERPVAPSVRLALRPSSLRRQIQVLDAMYAADVGGYLAQSSQGRHREEEGLQQEEQEKGWVEVYSSAGWSLLNAHRDALRESRFYLDDLYGWTPRGLREVVLSTLLSLDLDVRRKLLRRWRYRTEDRRSQVLSLLAALVFRPRLEEEEASGDDPDAIRDGFGPSGPPEPPAATPGLPVEKGFLWFLNLWLGFYLPQILARNRADLDNLERPGANRVRGVGWNLLGGPVQAVRETLNNREIFSTGMLFVDPEPVAKILVPDNLKDIDADPGKKEFGKEEPFRPEVSLLVRLWCYYGYEGATPWAAVSFWRGLSLIGLLLSDDNLIVRCRQKVEDQETARNREADAQGGGAPAEPGDAESLAEDDPTDVIRALIRKHLAAGVVPGSMLESGPSLERGGTTFSFAKWPDDEETDGEETGGGGTDDETGDEGAADESENHPAAAGSTATQRRLLRIREGQERVIDSLAEKLVQWLGTERGLIPPMQSFAVYQQGEDASGRSGSRDQTRAWRRCFTRRLHGEEILGRFWCDLEAAYFEQPANKKIDTAATILSKWTRGLLKYWSAHSEPGEDGAPLVQLLRDCPLLEPFAPRDSQSGSVFLGKSFKDSQILGEAPEDGKKKKGAPGLNDLEPVSLAKSPFADPAAAQGLRGEGRVTVPALLRGKGAKKDVRLEFAFDTKPLSLGEHSSSGDAAEAS